MADDAPKPTKTKTTEESKAQTTREDAKTIDLTMRQFNDFAGI
ncbi:hypothetical protein ACEWPL_013290 [Roseovarius sp. S1116L3]